MSIYRLVARLAAVSALNNYLEKPYPTLAGPNIFDSKIEPVEEMANDRVFPCGVVYTDYDKDHWLKARKAHSKRLMSFTFELLIVQSKKKTVAGQTQYHLHTPGTDSEIETSLDVFEAQIDWALRRGTEASDAFNYICPGDGVVTSRRGASTEGGQRLAARQITVEMEAVRENIAGVIPPDIGRFLDKLEQYPDYADRVPEIRSLLQRNAADTDFERWMKAFGYTRDVTARLGGASAGMVLPPNLNFHLYGPPATGAPP